MLYLTVMTPSLTRGENCENCENLSRLKINNLGQNCEKIVYLGSIFLNNIAVRGSSFFPLTPESNVVVYSKESRPDSWAFVGSNIEVGEGDFFLQRHCFGNSFVT